MEQDYFRITIRFISSWIAIIPLLAGLIKIKKLTLAQKVILGYCLLSLIVERIIYYLWQNSINNLPFFHFFTMIEFAFFATFFKIELKQKLKNKLFGVIIILFLAFCVFNLLFIQSLYEINSYSRTLEAIILTAFSIFSFRVLMQRITMQVNNDSTLFCVSCGVLLYFSGAILLFFCSDLLSRYYPSLSNLGWSFHSFLNIIFYILLFVSLWQRKKT